MNNATLRALAADAFFQVLDNKVFRLLLVLALLLVVPTFVVAFEKESIRILFGVWNIEYADLPRAMGFGPETKDPHIRAIQALQELFVAQLGGLFGILFAIAATAFFVPRMLEKGAADALFSKPVPRFVLLFARYTAAVLFVALLSFALVLGMHVGFLTMSGFSDPGFLWSALTLVYVFALVHAVSTVVAVFTRSSVAAMLTTLLFFVINGCVHQSWIGLRFVEEQGVSAFGGDDDGPKRETPRVVRVPKTSLASLHYVLPKTTDADALTKKLRTVIVGDDALIADPVGQLIVTWEPEGLARTPAANELDLTLTPVTWTPKDLPEAARIVLSRRDRMMPPKDADKGTDKVRPRRQSAMAAASELTSELEKRPQLGEKPSRRQEPMTLTHRSVRWTETEAGAARAHERVFLESGSSMVEIDASFDATWRDDEARRDMVTTLARAVRSTDKSNTSNPGEWYEARLDWSAPMPFNAWFSIASSVLFAALLLALAAWKLSRIDF